MVQVCTYMGCIFYFPSSELGGGGRLKPPHIHVAKGKPYDHSTSFWLDEVKLKYDSGEFKSKELSNIESYIKENRDYFIKKWFAFFSNSSFF